jgi:hypothetical protein
MTRYGFYGPNSRDFLTYEGRILVQDDSAELEFRTVDAISVPVPVDVPEDETFPVKLCHGWAVDRRDIR